jgi:hypothetical protein
MSADQDSEFEFELYKSFHEQFAENQNHHQALLIKFVSAIAVVVVGYSIVFAAKSKDIDIISSDVVTVKNKETYSYTVLYLSNVLSHLVVWLLNAVNINIGYGFRRDQNVITNIRKKYLQNDYKTIFGALAFRADNKTLVSFLPNFNMTFYIFCLVIHVILFVSIMFVKKFALLDMLLLTPMSFSVTSYFLYYYLYKQKVAVMSQK